MDFLLPAIQFVVGLALFLSTGYAVARGVFGKNLDGAGLFAASIVASLLVPPALLLTATLALGVPFNQWWVVAGAYALTLIAAGALILRNEGRAAFGL